MTLKQGGQEFKAPRITPFDPKIVKLTDYTGKFFSEELQTFYTVIVEEEKLIARHQRHADIQLTPAKKDFFSGNALVFWSGRICEK